MTRPAETPQNLRTERTMTDTVPSTYPVELTADQIFGFSDLVRRLTRAYGADQENPLRHDLAAALEAFASLLPEPSEDDGDAYLAAVDAGTLPRWSNDPLPLTQPVAAYEAALLTSVTKALPSA